MVPTLTCGLLRSNFSLAMSSNLALRYGADDQNRTGDLVLTKDALCQLSYIGLRPSGFGRQVGLGNSLACQPKLARASRERSLERETGIEPATNSLEGCDS